MSKISQANAARVLNQGNSFGERAKNQLADSILSQFSPSNPSYFEVKRISDNGYIGALINDNTSSATGEKIDDSKSIVLPPGEVLVVGEVLEHLSAKWIVVKSEQFSDIYYKGTIQKTNNSLKFYYPPLPNQNSILCEVPCIVTNKVSLGSSENRFMTLPDKTVMVICASSEDTLGIYEGQRFILGRHVYKVDGIDDISVNGLLNIKMSQSQKNDSDNITTGIAVQDVVTTTETSGGIW